MNRSRILPPVIAVATLVLLFANAVPCSLHKRVLLEERHRLVRELQREQEREVRLAAETFALGHDPFYLERICIETWNLTPQGVLPLAPRVEAPRDAMVFADE